MTANSWSRVLAVSLITILAVVAAAAQSSKTSAKYDPTKEVKVKGIVSEVKESPGAMDPTILIVKSGDKTTSVLLAPAEFLKEIECWVKAGDEVEVTGAKVPDATPEQIMAREVVFGNNTMVLRDPKGVPIWEGWKPSKGGE
jgi:hypothetical protein